MQRWGGIFLMRVKSFLLIAIVCLLSSACSEERLGWGILLWSNEDPDVPSGAVLPVYIRSNINQVWIAGIPEYYQNSSLDKFEIPFARLELVGSRAAAERRAEEFANFARTYAETLQDGLPIRAEANNSSRRVYRLRNSEIVKILNEAEGVAPVNAAGEPLQGSWYRVLTEDGTIGYAFSFRLRLFEHAGGPLEVVRTAEETNADPDLEFILSQNWYFESYGAMINNRRLSMEELSQRWGFLPGTETRIAHIFAPNADVSFQYTNIRAAGNRLWRFEDSSLQMRLRANSTLEVQFTEGTGALRTLLFVTLPQSIDELILQESARRETLFRQIYAMGPVFSSERFGTISFTEEGRFTWTGYEILVPNTIPRNATGRGYVNMGLFLSNALSQRYDGAFSLQMEGLSTTVDFFYTLETQGMRIEYIPPTSRDGILVSRQPASPLVIFFSSTTSRPLAVVPLQYQDQEDF